MKPLHAGWLCLGATLAGALAFKVTKQPIIPDPPPIARLTAPAPPMDVQAAKPSPLVAPAARIAAAAAAAVQTAPPPIYNQPPARPPVPAPAKIQEARKVEPKQTEVRKTSPVLVAAAKPVQAKVPPTQWVPTKYQTASQEPQSEDKTATPADQPAPIPEPPPVAKVEPPPAELPPAPAPPAPPRRVTLQTGMTIAIRLEETISSSGATPGDTFQGSLAEPLIVDHLVIAERGARATGRVVDSERGVLTIALSSVYTSDGQRVSLLTDPWSLQTESGFFRRAATLPTGTIVHFRISNRITVTEQIAAR